MRFRVLSAAAALLAAAPGTSLALGLGEVQLRSTLNAPLNADIELIANAEELASLRAQLASRESFARYGLDYPAFLTGIQVRMVRLADGRNVIRLTSTSAMTEPFATLLVEASWARGRIQREYTLLFDPPAFAPAQTAPAPIAAPTTGAGERSGQVARQPAPAAAPAPAPAAGQTAPAPVAPAAAPAGGGGEYQVRGGDSLSAIARREYGLDEAGRGMIAIYRANPGAFGGNINNLRAGAVLRLPEESALAGIDRAEATSEVRRQAAAWAAQVAPAAGATAPAGRAPATAPAAGDEARLRLVPPGGAPAPARAGTGTGAGSAEATQLRDRVAQLEAELAESRRLLELRSAELARLQGQGAAGAPPADGTPPATAPSESTPPADASATPPATEPAAPPAEAAPPAPEVAAAPAPKPAAAEPSLVERLRAFWYVPAGLLVLLLGLLGLIAARRRREAAASFAPFAAEPADLEPTVDTFPVRSRASDRDPSIVVEESGTHRALEESPDTHTIDLGEGVEPTATASGMSMTVPALGPDSAFGQGDPLAEADFHMAYGLYDQAADLVKLALEREPARRDLKLKLVEVFFVWGNKDQFLQAARELAATRQAAPPGEWEKVVIMGKQLAPEDPLFSKATGGMSAAAVDLNLEGGQNLVDFDLPADTGLAHDDPTAASSPGDEIGSLDFVLDDNAGIDLAHTATTRQLAQPGDGVTQRVELAPTVEQPLPGIGDLLAEKLDAHAAHLGSDQTAELALDDLGLDLGKFESTGTNLLEDANLAQALESGRQSDPAAQASTRVQALDDQLGDMLEASEAFQPTEMLPLAELDLPDVASTSRVAALDLNLDLDANAETGKRQVPGFDVDLDVGTARPDTGYQATQRIDPAAFEADGENAALADLEPVTMSEVGTKLDLARAYMDMGDPDGARSILGEVLHEGTDAQKQEAQRLLDSIPG